MDHNKNLYTQVRSMSLLLPWRTCHRLGVWDRYRVRDRDRDRVRNRVWVCG
mgnify:CR=1 FL=1